MLKTRGTGIIELITPFVDEERREKHWGERACECERLHSATATATSWIFQRGRPPAFYRPIRVRGRSSALTPHLAHRPMRNPRRQNNHIRTHTHNHPPPTAHPHTHPKGRTAKTCKLFTREQSPSKLCVNRFARTIAMAIKITLLSGRKSLANAATATCPSPATTAAVENHANSRSGVDLNIFRWPQHAFIISKILLLFLLLLLLLWWLFVRLISPDPRNRR